jgi:hypothetical protein
MTRQLFNKENKVINTTAVIIAVMIVCFCSSPVRAQWTQPDGNQNINSTNTGNVGIGTTAPGAKLTVSSNTQAAPAGLTGTTAHIVGANGATTRLLVDAFGPVAASIDMRKANNTAGSPTAVGANEILGQLTWQGRGATSYNGGSRAKIIATAAENYTDTAQGAFMTFHVTPTGGLTAVEAMRIASSGFVGIGTTTPTGLLSLRTSSGDVIQSFSNAGGIGGELQIRYKYESAQHRIGLTDGLANWLFYSQWAPSNTDSIAFFPGRVGIGTSNPSQSVDVAGNVNAAGLCIAGDCKTAWSQVGGGGSSQWTTAAPNIYFNTGNVGIGTTNPTQKLEINGAALVPTIYGSSAASGVLTLQSTSHATKGTINIGVDQTTTTSIAQSGTPGNKLIVATDRLIVNNAGVRVNGATDYSDLSVTKINITNPDALQFRTTTPTITSNGSMLFSVQNVSGDNVKFSVQNNAISNAFVIDSTGGTPAKLLDVRNLGTSKFSVDGNGNVTAAGNIAAKYQDVAEWVPAAEVEELPAGTVVVLDRTKSNHVISSTKSYDQRVAGVISAQPGIMLGERDENKVLVATTGRVLVNVDATNGPIEIGDLLVTSDREGVAMKSQPVEIGSVRIHRPGTLLGKALEPLASGTGKILVLLSLQ